MNAKRDYPLRDSKRRVLDWWGSNNEQKTGLFTLYCDNLPVGNVEKRGDGKYYGFQIMSGTVWKPHDDLETAKEWVLQSHLQQGEAAWDLSL